MIPDSGLIFGPPCTCMCALRVLTAAEYCATDNTTRRCLSMIIKRMHALSLSSSAVADDSHAKCTFVYHRFVAYLLHCLHVYAFT